MQLGRSEEIIFFIRWLNVHCDSGGSQLGPNGAADNPRVPARSPGLAPRALTRPPTGPITRGKTNKGSYYTLLMKDTRGEGGHAGHHRNKRALTDPSFTTTATARPLTPSPPPRITPASDPAARMPSWCVTQGGLWRSGEVGGLHGRLIE